MRRDFYGLTFSGPLTTSALAAACVSAAIALAPGSAAAQQNDTTVVPKSTPAPAPHSTAAGIWSAKTAPAQSAPGSNAASALKPAQDINSSSTASVPPNQMPPSPPVQTSTPAGDVNNASADEGAGWETAVEAAPGPTPLLGAAREAAVQKINAYFNANDSLQGTFTQVDSDNKTTTGRFYVERPGKLRFDYNPPSPLKLVSDGAFLSIEDSSLKTVEKYPIGSTPFKLLLAKNVDLERDARILGVSRNDNTLSILLEDKDQSTSGSIKLVFSTQPEMTLKQWVITDAQGLTTTVSLENVAPGRKVAADFFRSRQSFNPFQ